MYFTPLLHSDVCAVKCVIRFLILKPIDRVFAMSKDTHRAGGKQSLHEFWEMIAYIANTLIFILSGVIIAQSIFSIGNLENNTGC